MIDQTPAKLREQHERETKLSFRLGRQKAERRNDRLIKSGNRSQAASGVTLRHKYIGDIAKLMAEDLMSNTRTNKFEEADFYRFMMGPGVLDYVRLEDLANIGLSLLLDACGSRVNKYYKLTQLQHDIGDSAEHQARIVKAQQASPKAVDKMVERMQRIQRASTEKKHALVCLELELMAEEDARLEWTNWSHERKAVIGSWILWNVTRSLNTINPADPTDDESEDEILPWFKVVKEKKNRTDKFRTRFIYMTQEGSAQLDQIEAMAASITYQRLTMVVPPNPWTRLSDGTFRGGYYNQGPAQTKNLIHGPQKLIETIPSDTALEFLNKVQAQPWRINQTIYRVLKYFQLQCIEIGPFAAYNKDAEVVELVPDHLLELPEDDPRRVEAQKRVWKALQKQADLRKKSVSPNQVLAMAEENLNRTFWIPWFFDSRLRAYPLVTMLSPQGADYQKALLEFADGAEVTPDNEEQTKRIMLIGIATTYGNKKDKLPFAGRVEFAEQWVAEHLETVVADPEGTYEIWSKADEPLQHLALLLEYHRVFHEDVQHLENGEHVTRICRVPIGFDQTCSGLQLLGAFVRDEETCRLVNVTPSPEPQDAYAAVANAAKEILREPDRWKALIKGMEEVDSHNIPVDLLDRKVAKKVVMLIPYGGTYDTLHGHVCDAIEDWKDVSFMEKHFITKSLIKGMEIAVPGFSALNAWFKQVGKEVMNSGREMVKWRTAAGSEISQHYREPLTEQAKTFLVNKATYATKSVKKKARNKRGLVTTVNVQAREHYDFEDRVDHPQIFKGWGDVIKRKNETALAANWTHSQDAATLQLAFALFDQPFTTVHDCVYAPAPVIPAAVESLRHAFVSVVTWPALEEFKAINGLTCDLPDRGEAPVELALQSDYLFS